MSMLKQCDVISIRPIDHVGKLRAFMDIRIGGSLIIRGCTVTEGKNGVFAQMPRKVSRDGRWHNVILTADDELGKHYKDAMLKAYGEEVQK